MATLADVQAVAPSFAQAINWREQRGTFRINDPGSRITTPYIVSYAERTAAIEAIYGTDEVVSVLGSTVTRRVPLQHHEFTWMYAESVDFEDRGWDEATAAHSHCILDVTFTMPPWSDSGDLPYVEFRGGPSPRKIEAPASALETAGGVNPVTDPGILANGYAFELVLHNLPSAFVALAHLSQFQNRVNEALFLNTFSGGTVLCDGPSWQASRTAGNVETWTIGVGFRWTEDRFPWNYEVMGDGSIAEVLLGGTDKRYPTADFNSIFNF